MTPFQAKGVILKGSIRVDDCRGLNWATSLNVARMSATDDGQKGVDNPLRHKNSVCLGRLRLWKTKHTVKSFFGVRDINIYMFGPQFRNGI